MGRRKDRRRLGVTFGSVLRAARIVTEDPSFMGTSERDLSEAVLATIMQRSLPQARADMPEIDWENLLAFIEKLLPLILKLLAIF